ncbi:pentapeptide repeat-containing protein [Parafrankia sp. FMc2]|uniref:pentapeptide repeat-containing protein n=1 Tax=Parafrankia sp. FMc2 TaxID=3233196 RepID=UPI0034D3F42B
MVDNGGARRRAGRRGLRFVAGIATIGAVCAVVAIWHLPARMYPSPADADARAALQSGLLTAAAALTAVAGGLIALNETRQANAEVRRANENTHVRELYVEAVKLLNDAERGIRLAGIYALERIAVDSPADQRTVVEVLSAFVRDRSTDPALRQATPPLRPASDIRAAVQVLGRLPTRDGVPRADLTGADLTGHASLAHLDLADASLADAHLEGADLAHAQLSRINLAAAFLNDATLTGAELAEANLAFTMLERANLTETDLSNADLDDAQLPGANLTDAQLMGATCIHTHLHEANLTETRIRGVDLSRTLGLSQAQVNSALGDGLTRLPRNMRQPRSWTRAENE